MILFYRRRKQSPKTRDINCLCHKSDEQPGFNQGCFLPYPVTFLLPQQCLLSTESRFWVLWHLEGSCAVSTLTSFPVSSSLLLWEQDISKKKKIVCVGRTGIRAINSVVQHGESKKPDLDLVVVSYYCITDDPQISMAKTADFSITGLRVSWNGIVIPSPLWVYFLICKIEIILLTSQGQSEDDVQRSHLTKHTLCSGYVRS